MVGAIDVASNSIETPEEVADTLRKALQFVDTDRLYPSTNCGMAPLSRGVAQGKLKAVADSDPEALAELHAKARLAKAAADRWTDGVWSLRDYLVSKCGKMPAECDAMIGISESFDYVA
jgi:hypothetical protein